MSKVAIAGNASGTGTFTIAAPNSNTDRTLILPDEAGTVLTSASTTVLPKGGPAFSAYRSSNQSVSGSTWTKVACDTEEFDTASCYDNSTNYRFTPTVAGYYQITGQILNDTTALSSMALVIGLYKNGSPFKYGQDSLAHRSVVSALVYANGTTDYFELYGFTTSGNPLFQQNAPADTYFQAVLVRAA